MSLIICMLLLHTFSAQSYLLQRSSWFFFYIWLNMRQYVIQNEVISQETNLASLPSSLNAGDGLKMENVTDRWWGWNFVCLFLLYSTAVNNLVPDWLIPMYQNRIFFFTDDYFQPFLFHLFFFIPDFPSLNDCLCLLFPPLLSIFWLTVT